MTNDPDQIRADIERTRTELSNDVDALTNKVSPSRIVDRQTDKVKSAVTGVKDRVFGAAEDARDNVSYGAHDAAANARGFVSDAGDTVRDAPRMAKQKAQGNPLAAGLVAFGVGLLASSLIPSSRKEREMVDQVQHSDAVDAVSTKVKEAGQEMADNLKEPAQEAMEQVKATATEGAQQVTDEGRSAAQQVGDQAKHSAADVKSDAQDSAQRVRDQR